MKTKGGFTIENFKKLETPIEHGILEPHIYEGLVIGIPSLLGKTSDSIITWDQFGRCSNFNRQDCFIKSDDLAKFLRTDVDGDLPPQEIIEMLKECRDLLVMCSLIDVSGDCKSLVDKVDMKMGW